VAVRKLALAEFFGEYISSRSMVKDFVFSDEISSDSFGIVRTKGSPKFYNGESLGEICVEGRYFVTATGEVSVMSVKTGRWRSSGVNTQLRQYFVL